MPSRSEKVTNVDVAQRNGNIALVSKQIKLESRFGFQPFWSSEREAGKSDAKSGYFVMDRQVLNTGG